MDAEHGRLEEVRAESVPWRKWGPYLSERQWGTVRDDYSDNGDAWNYFSHDQARSRAVGHVHGPAGRGGRRSRRGVAPGRRRVRRGGQRHGRCHWIIEGRGQAADRLGLRPSTLRNRMKKLSIRRPIAS